MISIAQAYAHVRREHVEPNELVEVSEWAYDVALKGAQKFLPFDVEIAVSVEEGSLKQKITFGALVSALFFYGGIRQSVDYLIRDGRSVTGWINQQLTGRTGPRREDQIRVMRRALVIGQLDRLFRRVEEGTLTAREGTEFALALLEMTESQDTLRVLTVPLYQEFDAASSTLPPRYHRDSAQLELSRVVSNATGRRLVDGQADLIFPDIRPRALLPARSEIPQNPHRGEDLGFLFYKPLGSEEREKLLVKVRQPRR